MYGEYVVVALPSLFSLGLSCNDDESNDSVCQRCSSRGPSARRQPPWCVAHILHSMSLGFAQGSQHSSALASYLRRPAAAIGRHFPEALSGAFETKRFWPVLAAVGWVGHVYANNKVAD